jgi:succinyl-diaminopimelate desuccinylase
MDKASDALAHAKALIACESVTPARGPVFDALEAMLAPLGFECHRFVKGEPPDGPVENMLAVRSIWLIFSRRRVTLATRITMLPPPVSFGS